MWYVYMVLCRDNSLYTGVTNDLNKRLDAHNSARGAKYTRSRLPVRLLHCEQFASRGRALSREAQIKRLTREGKRRLIGTPRVSLLAGTGKRRDA